MPLVAYSGICCGLVNIHRQILRALTHSLRFNSRCTDGHCVTLHWIAEFNGVGGFGSFGGSLDCGITSPEPSVGLPGCHAWSCIDIDTDIEFAFDFDFEALSAKVSCGEWCWWCCLGGVLASDCSAGFAVGCDPGTTSLSPSFLIPAGSCVVWAGGEGLLLLLLLLLVVVVVVLSSLLLAWPLCG